MAEPRRLDELHVRVGFVTYRGDLVTGPSLKRGCGVWFGIKLVERGSRFWKCAALGFKVATNGAGNY